MKTVEGAQKRELAEGLLEPGGSAGVLSSPGASNESRRRAAATPAEVKAVLAKVVHAIKAKILLEHSSFSAIFKDFDKNGDGIVTCEEMKRGIKEACNMQLSEVEARTKQQKEELGEEKCAALAATLEAAIAHNERPIPEEALRSVPVPAISKVKSVPIATIRGGGATPLAAVPAIGSVVPPETVASLVDALTASRAAAGAAADGLWVEWSHIESAFINVTVLLDTRPLTPAP